jgi:apolipoprotein N-acyltransferase
VLEKSNDLIITISNDSWFGSSIGPLQHLQMAQFRALEVGRYLIRATNNGVSAIVDHKGHILQKTEQFKLQVLTGQAKKMTGETPYFRYGSSPLLLFCAAILLAIVSSRVILAIKT